MHAFPYLVGHELVWHGFMDIVFGTNEDSSNPPIAAATCIGPHRELRPGMNGIAKTMHRTSNLWIPSLTRSPLRYLGRYVNWDLNTVLYIAIV